MQRVSGECAFRAHGLEIGVNLRFLQRLQYDAREGQRELGIIPQALVVKDTAGDDDGDVPVVMEESIFQGQGHAGVMGIIHLIQAIEEQGDF